MELGYTVDEPIPLHGDNKGTMDLAENPVTGRQSKFIDIKHHAIHEYIQEGKISMIHTPTAEMVADGFTKSLACVLLQRFNSDMGLSGAQIIGSRGDVETDRPSGPYRLHGPSRSGASYMLQIILWTNRTVMDCQMLPYTLSLYGYMLITAIIVLIHLMSIVLNFYCSLLLCPIGV